MLKGLTYKKKNQLLIAAALIALVLSWFLCFQKTWDAFMLNGRLQEQLSGGSDLAHNPGYTNDRLGAINAAYDLFKVDSTEWRNELWLQLSGMASSNKYQLVYNSQKETRAGADSVTLRQNIRIMGRFRDLIQLLDSAESIRGIGQISALKLTKPERPSLEQDTRLITMEIQFRAVPGSYMD